MSDKATAAFKERAGKGVEALARKVSICDAEAESTRAEFYKALVVAHESSFTYEELATLTKPLGENGEGLSRIRIGQILKEERARQEAGE